MTAALLRNGFLIGAVLVAGIVRGETIIWSSPPQRTNLTSGGQAMDDAFQFQLGVFTGGFIPTAANIAEWTAHWESAQPASYVPASRFFENTLELKGNPGGFAIGAKAHVWGRRAGALGDEWILFRNTAWLWPDAQAMPPAFHDWSATDANEVILGTVNPSGSPFLMRSAAVLSYAQWRDAALAGQPLNGPLADPDHDGASNLLEFVFGTLPTVAAAPPPSPLSFVEIAGSRHLQIQIPRLRNRLAVMTVEVSGDLDHWTSGTGATLEISNTPDTLVVRDLTPTGPARFMRFKVETRP